MSGQKTFGAFKQRVLSQMTTTRVVAGTLAKTHKKNPKKLVSRDIGLLSELEKELKAQDSAKAWHLYSKLVQRDKDVPLDPIFGSKLPVVARHNLNTAYTHLPLLHSKILGVLQKKFMHGYTHADIDKMSECARLVVEKMSRGGLELTGEDICHLLSCFTSNTGAVDQIWQYATLSGVALDINCFNRYLNAKIYVKEYERAFEVVKEISEAGLQPNASTKGLLIRLYGRTGDLAAARRVFDGVSGGGAVLAYNDMLDVLGMNGLVDEMRQLFLKMTGVAAFTNDLSELTTDAYRQAVHIVAPDRETFHVLIKWHSQYWDIDTATQYVRVMTEVFDIQPVAKTFKLIITPQTAVREFQKCASVGVLMGEKYGIEPPVYILRTLERAGKKLASMEEKIRKSEAQRSSVFSGLFGSSSDDPSAPVTA